MSDNCRLWPIAIAVKRTGPSPGQPVATGAITIWLDRFIRVYTPPSHQLPHGLLPKAQRWSNDLSLFGAWGPLHAGWNPPSHSASIMSAEMIELDARRNKSFLKTAVEGCLEAPSGNDNQQPFLAALIVVLQEAADKMGRG